MSIARRKGIANPSSGLSLRLVVPASVPGLLEDTDTNDGPKGQEYLVSIEQTTPPQPIKKGRTVAALQHYRSLSCNLS